MSLYNGARRRTVCLYCTTIKDNIPSKCLHTLRFSDLNAACGTLWEAELIVND